MSDKEKNTPDITVSQETNEIQDTDKTVMSDTDNIIDKDKRIVELEVELLQIQQRERDSSLRAKAEVENIRKRSKQEIEKIYKFALERFFIDLLPVIDNLERAINMSDESNGNTTTSSTIEGVKLTLKSLLDTVHKFGLDVVNDENVPFNPEIHQAMTMLESDEFEPNYVVKIIQKGYILNGRLIRPAMVTVSK